MSHKILLTNKDGGQVMPITHSSCVYTDESTTLADILSAFAGTNVSTTSSLSVVVPGFYTYLNALGGYDGLIVSANEVGGANTIYQAWFDSIGKELKNRIGTFTTGSEEVAWGDWEAGLNPILNNYDLIFDGDTDFESYHGDTISNKTVFFKTDQLAYSVINVNFTNCVIYGNKKTIGTWGNIAFTNCEIYDLLASGQSGEDEESNMHYGNFSFSGCKITGGSASSYYDPSFLNSKCSNVNISGSYYACYASGCVFEGCDFNNQPYNNSPATTNSFFGCNFDGGSTGISGICYFSGCTGDVIVSSSATMKPEPTTLFGEHNFATLTIQ